MQFKKVEKPPMNAVETVSLRLAAAGVENAAWEAKILCECFEGDRLEKALSRRLAHYPLQYIVGEWDFYREKYEVDEHCLIPRSDTEILVEKAIEMLPPGAKFLDLCTGSGCIAISTLASRPDVSGVAVDLFEETLSLAKRNAIRNGVMDRVSFHLADVKENPPSLLAGEYDAILSNPPYIEDAIVPTLQKEVQFEPSAALCGGKDGMDFYRAILKNYAKLLSSRGFILFEIGYNQREALMLLAEPVYSVSIFKDYGGNDRVALLRPRST